MGQSFKHRCILGTLFIGFLSLNCFAQNNSMAGVAINITLLSGLNINLVNGDLDFGEVVQAGTFTKVSKSPENGIYLEVNGHPGRDIVIDYNQTSLTNKSWSESYGGAEGYLTFLPDVEYSNSAADYSSANPVVGGNTYMLSNNDQAKLHLWIGGEIDIPQDQPSGDYSGQFTVTVSY